MDLKDIWETLKQKYFQDDDSFYDVPKETMLAFGDFCKQHNITLVERRQGDRRVGAHADRRS